ncbi:Polymerase/histidinol phosphatase-like protein [Cladorrhinum samala]|uniref:Histidinol-phosphatase n=1 Tax=Cladorrhinum samala TaxID=585594 RepID=A0AAV9HJI8_9PEZI|nr:Polymerase/histidinol phosphatase-like protein [Cladorrhinum samala]
MAFTMHSHSGQFCPGHAKDNLEDIVQHAIAAGYKTIGLTEHMPRTELSDLYPEELVPSAEATLAELFPRHDAYLDEAVRLQAKYADQVHILIGFEGEWIRPSYGPLIQELSAHPIIDYFIGSLHHTKGIPIDFDKAMYEQAIEACGGTEEGLFDAYFDEQYDMLKALKPKVVGHFDLIRLFSATPGKILKGAPMWEKVVRNLKVVKEYGGWLELNTSAFRKGLEEGYPKKEIAEEWLAMGGRFTFSDDSHGIAQVSTNYLKGLKYLEDLGVNEVWTFERQAHPGVKEGKKSGLTEKAVTVEEFRASLKGL